jgi:hypothetical protein
LVGGGVGFPVGRPVGVAEGEGVDGSFTGPRGFEVYGALRGLFGFTGAGVGGTSSGSILLVGTGVLGLPPNPSGRTL